MKYFIVSMMILLVLIAGCESKKNTKAVAFELSDEAYLKEGGQIAMSAFGVLSSELQKAMKEGGVPNAVKYCNLSALPLTDSLSQSHNVKIKRTSDKIRNPSNTATSNELVEYNHFKEQLKSKELLKPRVKVVNGEKVFYAPILLSEACLKCHGDKSTIKDYNIIAALYPKDQATGYSWRFTWDVEHNF